MKLTVVVLAVLLAACSAFMAATCDQKTEVKCVDDIVAGTHADIRRLPHL